MIAYPCYVCKAVRQIYDNSTDPTYHKGYNPTGPIELPVRIPKLNKETNDSINETTNRRVKIQLGTSSDLSHAMRDLYHRQDRLRYWVRRVNTDLEDW
jgi:hypothetical protein